MRLRSYLTRGVRRRRGGDEEPMVVTTQRRRRVRRYAELSWVLLVILILLTFGLGWIGWIGRARLFGVHDGLPAYENSLFLILRAFIIDGVYIDSSKTGNSPWLIAARWTGAAAFAWGLVTAFISLSQERLARWRARLSRGHVLVIGDHAIVQALIRRARRANLPTIHVSDFTEAASTAAGYVTLPRHVMQEDRVRGLDARAGLMLIAETDTGASAETTLNASRNPAIENARIRVHLDDPVAAEGFHHLPGGYDILTFSLAQAAAREVLLRQPPFVLARRIGAPAIHVLILGYGRLGESLLTDILVNSVSSGLASPWITVVDDGAETAEQSFLSRFPEAGMIGQIRFVRTLDNAALDSLARSLEDRASPPVCAAYVCIDNSADAFSAAIALRERAQRDALFEAPIFVYLSSGGGLPRLTKVGQGEALPLLGFGDLDDVVAISAALQSDSDAHAKAVNQAYGEVYSLVHGSDYPPAPWRTLPEPMRASNRRVITHIPAKLASMGFDLEPLLLEPLERRLELPALHPDHPLFRGDNDRQICAELEHRRWMADRQLSGWRLGARDNRRKYHPDLVPFEALSDAVQAFDYGVNDWLDLILPRRPDGLKRPL